MTFLPEFGADKFSFIRQKVPHSSGGFIRIPCMRLNNFIVASQSVCLSVSHSSFCEYFNNLGSFCTSQHYQFFL